MERADRLPPGRPRPRDGREIPGRRRTVRLHRRRIEHVAERTGLGVGGERARDVDRSRPAIRHRRRSRLPHRDVRRRARRAADRARQQQHRRRDRVERRISRQQAAVVSAVRRLRHGGHRRLQLPRDAPARSQADVAAPSGDLRRRAYAAAGRGRARSDRMDGAAGDEGRTPPERRCADRTAARHAAAAHRGVVGSRGDGASRRGARAGFQRAARRRGRCGAGQRALAAARGEESARARTRRRGWGDPDGRRDLRPRGRAA